MLPRKFDPVGSYSARQDDRTRGYRILAHAEFESYLEDVTADTAKRQVAAFKVNGHLNRTVRAMLFYANVLEQASPASDSPSLAQVVDRAERSLAQKIKNNNGIKAADIKGLLLPVGIRSSDIDQTWLATADSFGADRGLVAHRTARTTLAPDPKTELDTVRQILKGFGTIDSTLQNLGP